MTKDEFVEVCVKCGYAKRKNAEVYAESKEELTFDDIVEVYRLNERIIELSKGHDDRTRILNGAKTTKKFKKSDRFGSDSF